MKVLYNTLLWSIIELIGINAHSWLDCVDSVDNNCRGYTRGYAGHIDEPMTHKILGREVNAPICRPGSQDNPEIYSTKYPRTKARPGQTNTFIYSENGHVTKDQIAPSNTPNPKTYTIHWTGKPYLGKLDDGSQFRLRSDLKETNQLGPPRNFDDGSCAEDATKGRAGPKLCQGSYTIPPDAKPGVYQFVWWWKFDKDPVAGGEEYTSCFDVEVTDMNGKSMYMPEGAAEVPLRPSTNSSQSRMHHTHRRRPTNIQNPPRKEMSDSEYVPSADQVKVVPPRRSASPHPRESHPQAKNRTQPALVNDILPALLRREMDQAASEEGGASEHEESDEDGEATEMEDDPDSEDEDQDEESGPFTDGAEPLDTSKLAASSNSQKSKPGLASPSESSLPLNGTDQVKAQGESPIAGQNPTPAGAANVDGSPTASSGASVASTPSGTAAADGTSQPPSYSGTPPAPSGQAVAAANDGTWQPPISSGAPPAPSGQSAAANDGTWQHPSSSGAPPAPSGQAVAAANDGAWQPPSSSGTPPAPSGQSAAANDGTWQPPSSSGAPPAPSGQSAAANDGTWQPPSSSGAPPAPSGQSNAAASSGTSPSESSSDSPTAAANGSPTVASDAPAPTNDGPPEDPAHHVEEFEPVTQIGTLPSPPPGLKSTSQTSS